MQQLTLKQTQDRALDLLVHLDEVCRANLIPYSLFYGTLIGLERHQGMIPWDDDIDVVLRRPDYEKLLPLLAADSKALLLAPTTRPHFRYPFAKLVDPATTLTTKQSFDAEDPDMGVFVDIFPLDGIPADQAGRVRLHDECEQDRLNMMDTIPGGSYARSFSPLKGAIKRVVRYPHYRRLHKEGNDDYWRAEYEKAATRYPFAASQYCGYLEWIDRDWGVFPTAWFADDQFEDVTFAGYTFKAIQHRRDFLKLRFGDYMKEPPVAEQVTHHPYTFYLK